MVIHGTFGYPLTPRGVLRTEALVRYINEPEVVKLYQESDLILLDVLDSVSAVSRLFYFSICTEK